MRRSCSHVYRRYRERLHAISGIQLSSQAQTRSLLPILTSDLFSDLEFVQNGIKIFTLLTVHIFLELLLNTFTALESKTADLDKLRKKESPSAKAISELEWDVEEYQFLANECRWATSAASQLDSQTMPHSKEDHQAIESKYKEFRSRVESLVRGVVRKQRQAASHAMVLMISPEARARKPYAVPVQLLLYRGMKDSMMRDISNKLKREMTNRGMEVVGKSMQQG